jgi:hypothetical protein
MFRKDAHARRRWASLAAVAVLLALCLILLAIATPGVGMPGGRTAAADEGPLPRRPAPARENAMQAALLGMEAGYLAAAGPQQAINPGFTVDLTYDAVWGLVDPGDVVTVNRTADGAYGAAEADGLGFFWTYLWQANGQPADIADGDTIEIYVNGSLEASIPVVEVTGGIDVLTDQVVGTISGDTGGTVVTLTLGVEGQQPGGNAPQQTATTNGSGSFAATFASVDLGPSMLVAVEVPQGGHTVRTYLYPDPRVFLVQNLLFVRGYADPGQQIDVTCYEGSGPTVRWSTEGTAEAPHGWYNIWPSGSAQAGDVVEVDLGDGQVLATTVAAISVIGVDPALDQVVGTAPPGAAVTLRLWQLGAYAQTTTTADGNGDFTAVLTDDLRPRDEFQVSVADPEGDESLLFSGAPFVETYLDPVEGGVDAVYWRVDGPGLPITLTIQTATDAYTRTGLVSSAGNGSWPYCNVIRDPYGALVDFSPGDTITVRSPTWEGSMVIADISWAADTTAERVSGDAPPGELEVSAHQWKDGQYPIHGSAVQTGTAASPYSVVFSGFDVRDGGVIQVRHFDPVSDFGTNPNWLGNLTTQYFEVSSVNVQGVPPQADEHITAYLYDTDGTTLLASTDNDYDDDPWRFQFYEFQGYVIEPGYWLTVTADSGWTAGLQVPELTVRADEDTDLVRGEGPKAWVVVEHAWDHGEGWQSAEYLLPVDGYLLDVAYFGAEIERGDWIQTRYPHPNGNRVRAEMAWPLMQVYYGTRNSVGGLYAPGHTFWITVTNFAGAVKATTTVTSTAGGGGNWWGIDGFLPTWLFGGDCCDWSPAEPDIQPGDWVNFQSDDGYENQVQAGTIYGTVDVEGDSVTGPIYAAWLTQTLEVWCYPDHVDGPPLWRGSNAEPDGSVPYFCEWHDPTGGQEGWDIQPDDEVLVSYLEPDGDQVYRMMLASQGAPLPRIYLPLVLKGH